ncbi:MAG: ion transporter [Patescibacteria group bacterium]|mgnify:CR=1 FL=1
MPALYFLRAVLTEPHHRYYFLVSDFLALTTFISVVSIVLETVPSLQNYHEIFNAIEWISVGVFSLEYVLRVLVVPRRLSYMFGWFGLIDLASILPTYLGLGNWTFLKAARIVRMIRLLRLLRVTKMRSIKGSDQDERLSFYTINILLFLVVLVGSMLLVGVLIYIVEGDTEVFISIPEGMLWAFRVFIEDNNLPYPSTEGGQFIYIFARVVGLSVFGVLIGILGNVIRDGIFSGKGKT